jgi:plastocyanin
MATPFKEEKRMNTNMKARKPTTLALFFFMVISMLALLAACGNNTSTASSAPSPTATAATSSTDTTYGGGRYGYGGGNTTPTSTRAVTGPTQAVTITTNSSGSFVFSPATLTIKVGTTVTWKNTTQTPHTVTSLDANKTFNSGDNTPINSNMTFSFTFTKAGTYKYQCDFHPQTMQGTITVQ